MLISSDDPCADGRFDLSPTTMIICKGRFVHVIPPKTMKWVNSTIHDARALVDDYVKSGVIHDDLFRLSLSLARLQGVWGACQGLMLRGLIERLGWTGILDKPIDSRDIDDLRNLWRVLETGDLCGMDGPIWLNPTFGKASEWVCGADADLIVGDLSVDIKVTKKPQFTREHFNQLVWYCVLDYLGDKRGTTQKTDDMHLGRAGIYFARHGVLHTIDINEIYDAPNFGSFVQSFEETVGRPRPNK